MIYDSIMNFFAGWFNAVDNLFFRLVLLPFAVAAIITGNILLAPIVFGSMIIAKIKKFAKI